MTGVFENRKTVITIDDYLGGVNEPWMAIQRKAETMATSASSVRERTVYIPHIGWRLKSYQLDAGNVQELTDGQAGILTGDWGSKWENSDTFFQAGLTGVTYASGVPVSGSEFYQKRIPAGESWDDAMADQGSYASPSTSEDATTMDRSFVSDDSIEPWDTLTFSFVVPGHNFESRGPFLTFFFNGPAGSDKAAAEDASKLGTGQYSLKCRGDGKAHLYERLVNESWTFRFSFYWSTESRPVRTELCTITIATDAYLDADENWQGSRMVFVPTSSGDGPGMDLIPALASVAIQAIRLTSNKIPVFNVPRLTAQLTTLEKVRVDCRRDIRAWIQVSKHTYPADGYVLDDYIPLEFPLTTKEPLAVYWSGTIPTGTSIACQLFDEEGTMLAAAGSPAGIPGGYVQEFTPIERLKYVRAKFTLTSSTDHDKTPTLQTYAIYRTGVWDGSPVTPIEIPFRAMGRALPSQVISSVMIEGQESDPTMESATVEIVDYTGELASLRTGMMRPIKIETEYDDEHNRAILFKGYVMKAAATPFRHSADSADINYPGHYANKYTLQCAGEWVRLAEAFTQKYYDWTDPAEGDKPWKVTDCIRQLLEGVYTDDQISIPDLPVRLFSSTPDDAKPEPGTSILDHVKKLAADYLGAYLIYDESCGDNGKWRLLEQKVAPYTNLAAFERSIDHPDNTNIVGVEPRPLILPHVSAGYDTSIEGDQEKQHTFMQAHTFTSWVERAEGNCVIVTGGATQEKAAEAANQSAVIFTQMAIKVDSYNFLGLPPIHPNYPDGSSPEYYGRIVPIRVFDYNLPDQAAVNWKTRRIYDLTCWARRFNTFKAPMLLITDSSDAEQVRPRRLRFYDAVQVRNESGDLEQFLIQTCRPIYYKDHIQMAEYAVVRQGNIDTIGVMPKPMSAYETILKVFAKATGFPRFSHANESSAKDTETQRLILPALESSPIQDLDPDSPTFGAFDYIDNYDPLP